MPGRGNRYGTRGRFVILCGASGVGKTAVRKQLAPLVRMASLGPDDFGGNWNALYDKLDASDHAVVECCKIPGALLRKAEDRGVVIVQLTTTPEIRARRLATRGEPAQVVRQRMAEDPGIGYDAPIHTDLSLEASADPAELARRIALFVLATPANNRRLSARQRGYNTRWDKARRTHLKGEPLCRMCLAQDRVTQATVVDHIAPHRGDQGLFWDTDNWQSLCRTHHNAAKQSEERSGQTRGCDIDGNPYARPGW